MKYLKRFVIPVLLLLSGIFLRYFLKELDISDKEFADSFERVGSILLIVSLAWAGIAFIRIFKNIFLEKYDVSKENNLRSRKFQTQFNIMERIIVFLIILISIGLVLMLFEDVKRIGVSLFASAGVAGVIIGLAAPGYWGGFGGYPDCHHPAHPARRCGDYRRRMGPY